VVADLRDEAEVTAAFEAALSKLGALDALFNVAGISGRRYGDGPWHECTTEGFEATFASNVRTAFFMTREALRYWMREQRPGNVLTMGSVTAFHPEPVRFATHAYAGSKGALESMTIGAAAYYAPHRIRLNVIAPGLVRTPMSARAQRDPEILEYIRGKQPLSDGMLEPEAIARAALFLLSEESLPITGQVVRVDGGWSVRP
jgi:NAD(P)-dependent dehydrogenase (short-subunit alcohol dehydrogenase family)